MDDFAEDVKISINFKDVLGLDQFLSSERNKILAVQTCDSKLELARIFNVLQQLDNCHKNSVYMGTENVSVLNWMQLRSLQIEGDEVDSNLTGLTIVDVLNYKTVDKDHIETLKQLFQYLSKTASKKVILICSVNRICFKCASVVKNYDSKFVSQKKMSNICFQDLTKETQHELLHLPCICFQGKAISLLEFLQIENAIDENLDNIITTNVLKNIIFNSKTAPLVNIGDNNNDGFYIQRRRFHNHVYISYRIKKLFTRKTEVQDAFIVCGIKDKSDLINILKVPVKKSHKILNNENIVIIQDQEAAQFFFNSELSVRPVHFIKYEGNQSFSWVSSKGSLENLRKFIVKDYTLAITEPDLLKKKVVVLSGPSGSGKSTTLAMLNTCLPSAWIINVNLFNCKDIIGRIPENIDQQNAVEFLATWIEQHFLVSGLLNNFLFTSSKVPVYILFDAFDEIADNLDSRSYKFVIDLLTFLKEKSQAYIWITALPRNSIELENALSQFSTQFDEINLEEQHEILSNWYESKLTTELEDKTDWLREFYKSYKTLLNNSSPFLGLPLVLKFLSDMTRPLKPLVEYENVCELVGKFVEYKIEKYMQDYFSGNSHKDEIVKYLNAIHGFVAFRLLCSELDELLGGRKDVVFHVDISKVGFVSTIKDKTYRFVHRIFAEYFSASMFYKWMWDPKSCPMEEFLLLKIFLEPEYKIIRLFLNHSVRQRPPPDIPKCVTTRLVQLLKQEKRNIFNKKGDSALNVLINENLSNLAQWFFQKDLIAYVLPLLSTRYKIFTPRLLPKIDQYCWVPNLIEKLAFNDSSTKKLFNLVRNHKLDEVKKLLDPIEDDVVRICISTSQCKSALHLAASLGFKDIVEYLIGIDIPVDILDSVNTTPIQHAASNGHLDVMTFLKTKGANFGNHYIYSKSALSRWAERGHLEVEKFLIEENIVDKDTLDRNGMSALQQAAKSGRIDIVELLLNKGCDVNHRDHFGMNALAWAVRSGNTAMVDFLIGVGADCSIRDQYGRNLIHMAVKANQWHLVKYLTFCLIDVNIPDWNNVTPLERAVKLRKWDVVENLILEGAHVGINNKNSFNPIHYAVKADEWPVVFLMIKHGGSLTLITAEEKIRILDKATTPYESKYTSFYKVIRLGNVELLKLLIQRNGFADISKATELDTLLAEPFEVLMLKDVVSNEMKLFVERKLVQLRTSKGQIFRLSEKDVEERIHFVCEQILFLKNNFFREKVDQEFIMRARFIAQNIELLKRSVRKTNIPWEQMEFCLVIFINFFRKPHPEDFEFRLILDQERFITYLENFSKSLQLYLQNQDSLSEYLLPLEADYRIMKDIYSLNRISRYIKLALSVNNYGNDISTYVLMRCLQVIGESFKNTTDSPNLSNDVHEYLLSSAPTNVKRIVTSLRDSLSHSHAYKAKSETENALKCDPDYFQTMQNDLQKIILQIDFLLYTKKKETMNMFYMKCRECVTKPNSLKNMSRYIDWDSREKMNMDDYEMNDLKIIRGLVQELKEAMQNLSENEQEMLNKLSNEVHRIEKNIYHRLEKAKSQYSTMRSNFRDIDTVQHLQFLPTPKVDICIERKEGIYYNALSILVDLLDLLQTTAGHRSDAIPICSQLCYIMKWDAHKIKSIQEIDSKLSGKSDDTIKATIDNVFGQIQSRLERQDDRNELKQHFINKRKLHHEFDYIKQNFQNSETLIDQLNISKRDKISLKKNLRINNIQLFNNIIGNLDDYGKLLKNFNSEKFYKVLKAFCSSMRRTSVDNALAEFIEEEENEFKSIFLNKLNILVKLVKGNENILKENFIFQSAAEILLLDILEACISKGSIAEYVLSFDESTPLLVGTALRNYLAHGNPLIDILPFNPLEAIISTGLILYEHGESLFVTVRNSAQKCMHSAFQNFSKSLAAINDNYDHVQENIESPVYEHFLRAANTGSLEIIERILSNMKLTNKIFHGNNKSILTSGNIFNSTIIWPAIILASQNGHGEVVKMLLDAIETGIKIKITNFTFKNVAQHLLRYKINIYKPMIADGNISIPEESTEKLLNTAYHLSAANGHHGIVKLLLESHGIIINSTNKNQESTLHLAAEEGHDEVVRILLENHINMNATRSDLTTPLHLAAFKGHIETIKVLLEYKPNVNAKQENGFTPLHISVANGHAEVAELLLKHGAIVDAVINNGSSALHIAAQHNRVNVAQILLQYKPNVNVLDNCKITPLYLAAASGYEEFVRILLENGARHDTFQDALTPLHVSALYGQAGVAKLLLERQANAESPFKNKLRALHFASLAGNVGVVEVLLDYHVDINCMDDQHMTPLHWSSHYGHKNVVIILLKNQANVNAVTVFGQTPLHSAAGHCHVEVAKLLLIYKAHIDAADNNGRTPLHLSALMGHNGVVDILLENYANIHAESKEKDAALHFAAAEGHDAIVTTLLKHGADVNIKTVDLFTPLHFAAQNNHEMVAKVLIQFKADINAEMANQATPLHTSAQNGHVKLAKLLLENNADVNACITGKFTALHLAAANSHDEVVKVLLENKANINATTNEGATPLYLAAKKGHESVIKSLLAYNADMNVIDKNQNTALQVAEQNGQENIVKLLLSHQTNV